MSEVQQPVEQLYPNPVITASQPNSSHSNGSFGPVFIVLAVIVVISAVACVLGRLCNRRLNRVKEGGHHNQQPKSKSKPNKMQPVSQGLGPKEWESRQKPSFNTRGGDIELGFDMKMPSVKNGGGGKVRPTNYNPSVGNGPGHGPNGRVGHGPGHGPNGHGVGPVGYRPEVRFPNNV